MINLKSDTVPQQPLFTMKPGTSKANYSRLIDHESLNVEESSYNVIPEQEYVVFWCCPTNSDNVCIKSPTLHGTLKTLLAFILPVLLFFGLLTCAPFVGMKISYDIYGDTYDMNTGCKKGTIFCSDRIMCYEGDWFRCSFLSILILLIILLGALVCAAIITICVVVAVKFCFVIHEELISNVNSESNTETN